MLRCCFVGALQLIPYVFDELGAVGIAVSSSYGSGDEASEYHLHCNSQTWDKCSWAPPGYIGDDIYDPIWSALDAQGAIIFIHGTQTPSSTPIPHPTLGLPVTEVVNHSYRCDASHTWFINITGTPRDVQSRRSARSKREDEALFAPRYHTCPHGREHDGAGAAGRWARPIHWRDTFGGRDPT